MTRSATAAARTPYEPVRDIHWIRGALQTAVAIEHSAMPLYAAAMYSLEVQNYPAYNVLRSVLMEEMLHMAAACNGLAAIGGAPRIRSLDPTAITRGLPAGIAPGLEPQIAQLSRRQLNTFMRIESPAALLSDADRAARYPTIGTFYETIKAAIEDNAAVIRAAVRGRQVANQVGGNLGYATIDRTSKDPIADLQSSLDLIIDQGEGSPSSTLSSGSSSQHELSHYARFAELRYGRAYTGPEPGSAPQPQAAEGQRRWFRGAPVTWPQVINSLTVPHDGYAAILRLDPNRGDVVRDLHAFDAAYTRMLQALDDCWNGPADQSWPSLGRAVFEMNELRVTSCFAVLRHRVPPAAIDQLDVLYPHEAAVLRSLTDLDAPVFYGPRFLNTALPRPS